MHKILVGFQGFSLPIEAGAKSAAVTASSIPGARWGEKELFLSHRNMPSGWCRAQEMRAMTPPWGTEDSVYCQKQEILPPHVCLRKQAVCWYNTLHCLTEMLCKQARRNNYKIISNKDRSVTGKGGYFCTLLPKSWYPGLLPQLPHLS